MVGAVLRPFLAVMSLAHEIKNPLASIRSAVEQLARTALAHPDEQFLANLIVRDENGIVRRGFSLWTKLAGKSVAEGAATSCYVATNEVLGNVSGRFFEDCNAVEAIGGSHLQDAEQASRLWLV